MPLLCRMIFKAAATFAQIFGISSHRVNALRMAGFSGMRSFKISSILLGFLGGSNVLRRDVPYLTILSTHALVGKKLASRNASNARPASSTLIF
jgi:hypothetical protein